jgi:heat shock protein HtpX
MYKAIAANKRNTVLIMAVFVAILGVIAWLFSLYYGNPTIAYITIGISIVYALFQYFAASSLAVMSSGAEEISKSDNPRLWRTVENLAITTGLPMPRIYIIDDPAPNAFATGRNPKHAIVAATQGLLDIMDDSELEGVIAHELGHVQNYDIRVSMIAYGLASIISSIANIGLQLMFFGGRDRENSANPLVLVGVVVAVILSPIIATIIQLAVSRQREYLADATSALTTRNPEELARALEKLEQYGRPIQKQNTAMAHLYISNPLKPGLLAGLFSTHPPLEARIARLRQSEKAF